jgi:hypothetical protein
MEKFKKGDLVIHKSNPNLFWVVIETPIIETGDSVQYKCRGVNFNSKTRAYLFYDYELEMVKEWYTS